MSMDASSVFGHDFRARLQQALGTTYTLERELGGGGMARVFVAEERTLGRRVVVKVLPPATTGLVSTERFRREARLAARLQHPHIVPLLVAGDAAGLLYYTMPLVEGESLRAWLAREGALPVPVMVRILRDVARALAHAHRHGIVHRDIKPGNVLLDEDGDALVTDFGVAKALAAATGTSAGGTLTSVGLAVGTPAYMAPEQALADPAADHRADLYALGVLAYEALAGSHPFAGRTPQALVAAHASEVPEALTRRRPGVPPELAALVMRLLEKHPADRPQSADEVLRALESALTPPPVVADAAPARATARSRWWAASALAVALLAAVVATWRGRVAPTVDQEVVAIAPFRVTSTDTSLDRMREGMVDLLTARLQGESGLRSTDPRTVLSAWRRAAGSLENDLDPAEAARVAERIGAGRVLLGEIVGTPDHVTLSARLLPAGDDRHAVAAASVEGPLDSLPALVDRLAAQLLSLGSGQSRHSLAALTSTSLPALRAYVDGQAAVRRGRFAEALADYTRAAELDTAFALAGIGLLQASSWAAAPGDLRRRGGELGRLVAWRGRERLSPRDRALLDVRLGSHYPAPVSAAERIAAAERFAALAPDSPDAMYELGDAYFHHAAVVGVEDADARAFRAFSRAVAYDSSYVPALEHLPALHHRAGDTAGVRRTTELLLARDSTSDRVGFVRWYAAVALGDSAAVRALRARIPGMELASLGLIVQYAVAEGMDVDDAERALRARRERALTDAERATALGFAYELALERGTPSRAVELLGRDFAAAPELAATYALDAVFADGDSSAGAQAAAVLETRASQPMPLETAARLDRMTDLHALAQYRLAHGDPEPARRVVPLLRAFVAPRDSAWLADGPTRLALLLDAQLAVRDARPGADSVVVRLDSALRARTGGSATDAASSLVMARLWEARGDSRRALRAVRRREFGLRVVPMAAVSAREEGRLAALVGDRDGAIRAYRRHLAIRARPEHVLARDVARVRAALARVEGRGAGGPRAAP